MRNCLVVADVLEDLFPEEAAAYSVVLRPCQPNVIALNNRFGCALISQADALLLKISLFKNGSVRITKDSILTFLLQDAS